MALRPGGRQRTSVSFAISRLARRATGRGAPASRSPRLETGQPSRRGHAGGAGQWTQDLLGPRWVSKGDPGQHLGCHAATGAVGDSTRSAIQPGGLVLPNEHAAMTVTALQCPRQTLAPLAARFAATAVSGRSRSARCVRRRRSRTAWRLPARHVAPAQRSSVPPGIRLDRDRPCAYPVANLSDRIP